MKKLMLLALPLLAVLAGCSDAGASGKPTIVVTTNILGDITSNIVGDQADVMVLMPPNSDPHSFEISAAEAARVESADLMIVNGLGLEEGVAKTIDAARSEGIEVVEAGPAADPIQYVTGQSTGAEDPHIWTDPERMRSVVTLIRDAVNANVDGVNVDAAAADYDAKLVELDARMAERFDAIAPDSRKLVTNHHVFGYLADRYGFEVIGAVIPSGTTLASPSASDLSELAGTVRDAGVRTIFVDSSQPDRLAQVMASEAGIEIGVVKLFTESLGDENSEAPTYLEMMDFNSAAIAEGLGR
ncbi:zinc ABC transporter substrate-binding protein [Rhodococcus sp. BP-252]|uniref:zinc ABC transporter substrate-binding protein AztC n=1 Tax=unclassified Rhodococcus (in: high G+C Gram-positive bacteria) TaxID=192944 RepID=UPI001C9AF6BA|nr:MULTISPECIES: zinc ABC transporter substrate-binding protein AztC [unclassified Rhodococcus (in: high G+C Gram-positive bacteria)]MBY6414630.1 zinc ABC transporter substrate-binding protein [Rhodococcus sp. BP-320]MBY6419387.1 zinc ABC transporter substrate-binding protein [Rhodococcus sp. BP-321]MBY6424433.1 zinc ABC transporter substrate-binding protein [Rhodococcus sp. BP-324]MBY6429466.1 zinc ABC transporter substrate-binding protein [Rhodococcus sp. BP-323]MBY6434442.1 zinc ABC transpo